MNRLGGIFHLLQKTSGQFEQSFRNSYESSLSIILDDSQKYSYRVYDLTGFRLFGYILTYFFLDQKHFFQTESRFRHIPYFLI